jgi:hypothetical protein
MAGSYNHCVDDEGRLRDAAGVQSMLDCVSGDVYEAIEEMYGMIWYLAGQQDNNPPPTGAERVEEARRRYREGLELSPGLQGTPTYQIVAAQLRQAGS